MKPEIERETWPSSEIGNISPDRVAILGTDSQIHLFDGNNRHYSQYFDPSGYRIAEEFNDSVASQAISLNESDTKFQVHISPNKSTCLNQTFSLYTPFGMTVAMKSLTNHRNSAISISFLDGSGEFESGQEAWWKTDSHINSYGAYLSARQILQKWNIDILVATSEDYVNRYTDLSYRWPGVRYLEPLNQRLFISKSNLKHEYVYQNYKSDDPKLRGRCSIAVGNIASERSLLVVGQSTMGQGLIPENVSYWILPHFKTSVILTEAIFPTLDFARQFSHVLFSIEERFILGRVGVEIFKSLISNQGNWEDFNMKFLEFFE